MTASSLCILFSRESFTYVYVSCRYSRGRWWHVAQSCHVEQSLCGAGEALAWYRSYKNKEEHFKAVDRLEQGAPQQVLCSSLVF